MDIGVFWEDVYSQHYRDVFLPNLQVSKYTFMYIHVLQLTIIPRFNAKTWQIPRIGYRSLVECRPHDFIHRISPPTP